MKSFFKQERKIKGINRNLQQPCSQRVRAFPRSDESPHDKESFAISTLKHVVVLIVQVIQS